jgi:hypothetical protein
MLALVEPITPKQDDKLQTLIARLARPPLSEGKVLIFTQYADTARYLWEQLDPSGKRGDIEVIYGGEKSKLRVVGRFAPKANPEYRRARGESEIMTLVATDVLAEGLNLQDCDKIVNYDLHWNPVRLIQRFGRIDRIGSDFDVIYGFNFLPETELDRQLGLKAVLHHRVQEIHDTIGEDSAILDNTEQLNEEAMYAIYEARGDQLPLWEEVEQEFVDLDEAEEMFRRMREEDPAEFQRIADLRDGVRSALADRGRGVFVFCQAGRYQQLALADDEGEIATREVPKVLAAIQCAPEAPARPLPQGYNTAVMRLKRRFDEDVRHLQVSRDHTLSLTRAQSYVLRELRLAFEQAEGEHVRGQIRILEDGFRRSVNDAVKRELNRLRRNGVTGQALIHDLTRIYHEHGLRDQLDSPSVRQSEEAIPRIICSEALV